MREQSPNHPQLGCIRSVGKYGETITHNHPQLGGIRTVGKMREQSHTISPTVRKLSKCGENCGRFVDWWLFLQSPTLQMHPNYRGFMGNCTFNLPTVWRHPSLISRHSWVYITKFVLNFGTQCTWQQWMPKMLIFGQPHAIKGKTHNNIVPGEQEQWHLVKFHPHTEINFL